MAARAGYITPVLFEAAFINYAAEDARAVSPELRPRLRISPQVKSSPPPANSSGANDPFVVSDFPLGARTQVQPMSNPPAITQRGPRGVGGTGRWDHLGSSPVDGFSVGFDYWEQVLIDPNTVALGNVVSATIFDVVLRNAFRRANKEISSIVNNAGGGITLAGSTPPAVIQPLADKVYEVTVSTAGPPNIDGTIDWIVDGVTYSVVITGSRIIIFQWPPQGVVVEQLEWLTDIIKKADGTEQRIALRQYPRQEVGYQIIALNQTDVNEIRNLMVQWTTRVFGMPVWWNEVNLTQDVAVLDTTITVRDGAIDLADFRVGGLAMIFFEDEDRNRTTDILNIEAVRDSLQSPGPNQIDFTTEIQNAYDARYATVVPVYPAVLTKGVKSTTPRLGDNATYEANFKVTDNISSVGPMQGMDYPSLDDFDGIETTIINDVNFLTGKDLTENFNQLAQVVDFNVGKFRYLTQEKIARRATPMRWVVEDASDHRRIRSLLYFLRGKWKTAWLPTWRQDFNVITNIGNGAVIITLENQGFARYVGGSIPWAGCRILQTDGTVSYHRITATAESDEAEETISIDPPAPNAIAVEEVERMDLMILARQSSDKVNITHNWMDAESDLEDTIVDAVFIGDVQ